MHGLALEGGGECICAVLWVIEGSTRAIRISDRHLRSPRKGLKISIWAPRIPDSSVNSYPTITLLHSEGLTTKKQATQSPKMNPYNFSRPHHPCSSLIFLNVPIRFSAASIPCALLSNPPSALFSTSFSASRLELNCSEDCFSACARERRPVVRLSCSVRLCVSSVSVCERLGSCCGFVERFEKSCSRAVVEAASLLSVAWRGFRDRRSTFGGSVICILGFSLTSSPSCVSFIAGA